MLDTINIFSALIGVIKENMSVYFDINPGMRQNSKLLPSRKVFHLIMDDFFNFF